MLAAGHYVLVLSFICNSKNTVCVIFKPSCKDKTVVDEYVYKTAVCTHVNS